MEDFAEGVVLAAERLNTPEPVNIGTGSEVSIRELVDLVVRLTDFKGKVSYDASKPKGQHRRVLSIEKARRLTGFEPRYSLEEGLKRTIAWYRENYLAESLSRKRDR